MTRADDLRAAAVGVVNAYILGHLDPGLAEDEYEALGEAGDLVDLVLEIAYRQTRNDLTERHQAISAGTRQIWAGREPMPLAPQAWWESWPATYYLHHSGEPEHEHEAGPCWCGNPAHTVVHIEAKDG